MNYQLSVPTEMRTENLQQSYDDNRGGGHLAIDETCNDPSTRAFLLVEMATIRKGSL